jgi:thioredoxin 1
MHLILTDENFEEDLKKTDKPVLVDFFATWCGPCEVLGPMIENVVKSFDNKIILAKVNVDQFPKTSNKFNIDRIPNVILFKDGKLVDGFVGLMPEESIKDWIEKTLNKL